MQICQDRVEKQTSVLKLSECVKICKCRFFVDIQSFEKEMEIYVEMVLYFLSKHEANEYNTFVAS